MTCWDLTAKPSQSISSARLRKNTTVPNSGLVAQPQLRALSRGPARSPAELPRFVVARVLVLRDGGDAARPRTSTLRAEHFQLVASNTSAALVGSSTASSLPSPHKNTRRLSPTLPQHSHQFQQMVGVSALPNRSPRSSNLRSKFLWKSSQLYQHWDHRCAPNDTCVTQTRHLMAIPRRHLYTSKVPVSSLHILAWSPHSPSVRTVSDSHLFRMTGSISTNRRRRRRCRCRSSAQTRATISM